MLPHLGQELRAAEDDLEVFATDKDDLEVFLAAKTLPPLHDRQNRPTPELNDESLNCFMD